MVKVKTQTEPSSPCSPRGSSLGRGQARPWEAERLLFALRGACEVQGRKPDCLGSSPDRSSCSSNPDAQAGAGEREQPPEASGSGGTCAVELQMQQARRAGGKQGDRSPPRQAPQHLWAEQAPGGLICLQILPTGLHHYYSFTHSHLKVLQLHKIFKRLKQPACHSGWARVGAAGAGGLEWWLLEADAWGR